jgi:hypothetical protein
MVDMNRINIVGKGIERYRMNLILKRIVEG